MQFAEPLIEGTLVRRRQRFVADVKLKTGDVVVAHCANSGSMMGACEPGSRVLLSTHHDPRRRFAHQVEIVYTGRTAVGVHSGRPVGVIARAIGLGKVSEVAGYATLRRIVRTPRDSAVDLVLEGNGLRPCFIAVMSVTLAHEQVAYFPDAVQPRCAADMSELTDLVREGGRAMVLLLAQRGDVESMRPADHVDPDFGATFRDAIARGVEAIGYRAKVSRRGIDLNKQIPVELGE